MAVILLGVLTVDVQIPGHILHTKVSRVAVPRFFMLAFILSHFDTTPQFRAQRER